MKVIKLLYACVCSVAGNQSSEVTCRQSSACERAALEGAYEDWRDCGQNYVFGDGLFYATDVAGSDIERHPEGYTAQPARHYVEGFYENGALAGSYTLGQYDKDQSSAYAKL